MLHLKTAEHKDTRRKCVLEKDILLSIFTEYMDLRRYSLLTADLFRSLYEFDIQEEFE